MENVTVSAGLHCFHNTGSDTDKCDHVKACAQGCGASLTDSPECDSSDSCFRTEFTEQSKSRRCKFIHLQIRKTITLFLKIIRKKHYKESLSPTFLLLELSPRCWKNEEFKNQMVHVLQLRKYITF